MDRHGQRQETNVHFLNQQHKLVAEASKERKEAEKQRRLQTEREYWEDIRWQEDKMYDGSDSQPYEINEREENV